MDAYSYNTEHSMTPNLYLGCSVNNNIFILWRRVVRMQEARIVVQKQKPSPRASVKWNWRKQAWIKKVHVEFRNYLFGDRDVELVFIRLCGLHLCRWLKPLWQCSPRSISSEFSESCFWVGLHFQTINNRLPDWYVYHSGDFFQKPLP